MSEGTQRGSGRTHAARAQARDERSRQREERREASGRARPSERRSGAARAPRTSLTLAAILTRAGAILDADGIEGLTLRRLARELGVGAASVYWYVDDKDELLKLCYEQTLASPVRQVLEQPIDREHWRDSLRAVVTDLYETLCEHPWAAELMSGSQSRGPVVMLIWDRVGQILGNLGLPDDQIFYAGGTLMGHVGAMTLAAAYDANSDEDRDLRLGRIAGDLAALDPAEFPFVSRTVSTFRRHTELEQFLGGLDLILDGIASRLVESQAGRQTALHSPTPTP